jgi:hypothetical protein
VGPEPLIVPFALLGLLLLLGSVAGVVLTKNAFVKGALCIMLLGAALLFVHQYASTKTIIQNITLNLMALGLLAFAGLFVVAMLALVLLPLKPFFVRVVVKFRNAAGERH